MNLRFGITGKLLVWFFVIIAIFYGTILVLYINVQQVVGLSGSIVAKNYAIASGTKKMTESLLSMEENKQKYLLLKKTDYLVFFNEAQHAFEENLTQVTRLTAMGPRHLQCMAGHQRCLCHLFRCGRSRRLSGRQGQGPGRP